MKPKFRHIASFAAALSLVAFPSATQAATYNWSGASNGFWNTDTNWSGTLVPTLADDLTILGPLNVAGTLNIDFDADNAAKSISFTNTAATTIANTASGADKLLTLGSGGLTTGTGAVTIGSLTANQGVNIALASDQTWNLGANLTMNSIISGTGFGLTKSGAGTLTLAGANSYTGATTISRGTVTLSGSLASTVLNLGGGTLSYTKAASTQGFTTTNFQSGASSATAVAGSTLDLGDLTRDVGGNVNFGNTGSIITSESNNGAGIIGGWATFNSQNWAVANGASAITGGATYYTTTTGGTTGSNYTNTRNMDVSGSVTMVGTINPSTVRFNVAGASTVTLAAGDNIIESGGILVTSTVGNNLSTIAGGNLMGSSGGDLVIHQNNTSNHLVITSIVKDNGTATGLTKTGAGTAYIQSLSPYAGNTYVNGGTLVIGGIANGTAFTAALGSQVGGSGPYIYAGNVSIAPGATFSYRNSTDQTLSGVISGGGNFSKFGGGTMVLTGANTFTGTTTVGPQGAAVGGAILSVSSINSVFTNPTLGTVHSDSSNLGAPTTVANGTITIGAGIAASSTLRYTGTGETTDRVLNFNFNSGAGHTVDASNPSGLLKFVSNWTGAGTAGTLTLAGTGNAEMAGGIPNLRTAPMPLTKSGTGTWILSGTNTYTGLTTVSGGVLLATKTASLPGYTTAAGVLFNGGTVGVRVGGSGWTTAEVDTLLTNATKTSGALGIDTTNGDLTQWTAFTTTNFGSAIGLTKLGSNKLILDKANSYAGATSVNEGTLQVDATGSLGATTAALNMGAGNATTRGTVGNLILNTDATVGTFTVRSNTATTTGGDAGVLTIASGKTLTTGNMIVGLAAGTLAGQDTRTALSTAGGGNLIVNGQLNLSQAGNSSPATSAISVLDLSGLANFTNNNASGNTVIGSIASGTLVHSYGNLTLASTSNLINALSLRVGNSGTANSNLGESVVNLGAGTNTIQASTIVIGSGKGQGTLQFAGANGSVGISGTNGSGKADITVGNATSATYAPGFRTNNLLLAGHTATVTAGAVIAGQNAGNTGGAPTAFVTFDTGAFNADSVTLASSTSGTSSGSPTATFTVGGSGANSSATGVLTVTGNFLLANHINSTAGATGTANGSLIINGGTVNIGSGATNGIFDASTSTTGGSTTTLTLAGGTLDLNGGAIGGTANAGKKNITNLNFESGTLKNVAQINNGAGLTKTTAGTLILSGTNTYSGGTNANEGILLVNNTSGSGTGTGALSVAAGAFLGGTGTIAPTGGNGINVSGVMFPGGSVIGNLTLDLASTSGTVAMNTGSGFNYNLGTANTLISSIGLNSSDLLTLAGASVSDFAFNSNVIDFLGTGEIGFYKLFDTSIDDASTWTGLTFDGTTGEITSGLSLTNLAGGLAGSLLVGTAGNGGTTGDIYLQVVAIPEPRTALLGALGLLALLRRRR